MNKKAIGYLITLIVAYMVLIILIICTVEKKTLSFTSDTLAGIVLGIIFSLMVFIAFYIGPIPFYTKKEARKQEEEKQ